jgi:hypothetical protein
MEVPWGMPVRFERRLRQLRESQTVAASEAACCLTDYGKYGINNGKLALTVFPLDMKPKLINGKVWIYVESGSAGGYQKLPEDDPKYREILLWIDSQRFVELLEWVYRQRNSKKILSPDV